VVRGETAGPRAQGGAGSAYGSREGTGGTRTVQKIFWEREYIGKNQLFERKATLSLTKIKDRMRVEGRTCLGLPRKRLGPGSETARSRYPTRGAGRPQKEKKKRVSKQKSGPEKKIGVALTSLRPGKNTQTF